MPHASHRGIAYEDMEGYGSEHCQLDGIFNRSSVVHRLGEAFYVTAPEGCRCEDAIRPLEHG